MNDELGDAPNKVRDVSTPLDMTASGEPASGDDLTESGEECIHLCLFADRHTHVVGQGWEQSADVDAALLHRLDDQSVVGPILTSDLNAMFQPDGQQAAAKQQVRDKAEEPERGLVH